MSLLMDALKKAEEAKRQAEAAAEKNAPLSPAATPAAAEGAGGGENKGLPELPSRLELLDDEFSAAHKAAATPPPKAAAEAARQSERAAAQNLFEAKLPPPRRTFPILLGAFALIAVAGIGVWFWWQMRPAGGIGIAPGAPRPAPQVAQAPLAPPAAPSGAPAGPPSAAALPQSAAAQPAPFSTAQSERQAGAAARPPAAAIPPAAAPTAPIRVTAGRPRLNPTLARAYQALMEGNPAAAQQDYEQVLKEEPKNTDALHGLAAISLQQGRPDAVEAYYLKILEADPKDASAQAGLVGLKGQADPVQSESRLKTLLAGQPDSPFLHFALGNLYARQGRWNEAQQAYFRAYSADPDNPDYQFNLAVSLDQLRQPRLALQYYQSALAAADRRPAAFDKNQAAGRIGELRQ